MPGIPCNRTRTRGDFVAKEAVTSIRRGTKRSAPSGTVMRLLRGLLTSAAATVLGVVVFALFFSWLSPSDAVISVMNQALKLASIFLGVWVCVGRGGTGGTLKGALLGLTYMMLGIIGYAFLSGLTLSSSAYLADLAMGVAAGGLCGMLLSGMRAK